MRFGYYKNPLSDLCPVVGSITKLFPVIEPTASDYVVYCSKCKLRMIEMTVQHVFGL